MASFPVCQGGHPGLECSRFEQALLPPVSIVLGEGGSFTPDLQAPGACVGSNPAWLQTATFAVGGLINIAKGHHLLYRA